MEAARKYSNGSERCEYVCVSVSEREESVHTGLYVSLFDMNKGDGRKMGRKPGIK